jgi:hypothetical protein
MLAVEADTQLIHQCPHGAHKVKVEGVRAADIQRQTVEHQGAALHQFAELAAETSADPNPVLRCNLKKIDRSMVR